VYSPPFNFSINGTTFEKGFQVAPGTYSLYAFANASGVNYTSLSQLTVNATGVASPTVTLQSGVSLKAQLVGPGDAPLNLTVPVFWTGPDGTQLYTVAVNGIVTLSVPGAATYTPQFNVTRATTIDGVLRYAVYSVVAGTSCAVGSASTQCSVPVSVSYLSAGITGQFYWSGAPITISGTVRLMGPYPSTAVTLVNTTSGTFTAAVLPGLYTLYATAGSGAGVIASLSQITVPFPSTNITVSLSQAWTDTLTLLAPSGVQSSATANVTWTNAAGVSWTATGVPVGIAQSWGLPKGLWKVTGNGSVSTVGPPISALANATVLLTTGNQATNLALVPQYTPAVTIATQVPANATVPDGGTATFSFTVKNTGNVPVQIRFYGDPAGWNFTFSPATMTLGIGTGNNTGGGTVTVRVPYGTATNHPLVSLGAVLVSTPGKIVGTSSPSPTVTIVPAPAISVTPGTAPSVTPTTATVNFVVQNTGNTPYSAQISVVNMAQLEQLGWTVQLRQGSGVVTAPYTISAGQTISFSVVLSTTMFAQAPGSVVVQALDLNSSGNIVASAKLPVPSASVGTPHGLSITGPNVGAPPVIPDWAWILIAVVPAVAFLAILLTVRWWRTRRWVRR
jgi:hypothetical protein